MNYIVVSSVDTVMSKLIELYWNLGKGSIKNFLTPHLKELFVNFETMLTFSPHSSINISDTYHCFHDGIEFIDSVGNIAKANLVLRR